MSSPRPRESERFKKLCLFVRNLFLSSSSSSHVSIMLSHISMPPWGQHELLLFKPFPRADFKGRRTSKSACLWTVSCRELSLTHSSRDMLGICKPGLLGACRQDAFFSCPGPPDCEKEGATVRRDGAYNCVVRMTYSFYGFSGDNFKENINQKRMVFPSCWVITCVKLQVVLIPA